MRVLKCYKRLQNWHVGDLTVEVLEKAVTIEVLKNSYKRLNNSHIGDLTVEV